MIKAFGSLVQTASAAGALDAKTKERIAIGIAIAARCTRKPRSIAALPREEILATPGMAIYMGAGPSAMYASRALGPYAQFAAAKTEATEKT